MGTNDTSTVPNKKACYAAFKAHDVRFDGRLYICVSSTGIYCRPVCRVKTPKLANCTFLPSAAAAEAAGYRPCLKCRPDLAPGLAVVDAPAQLARKAALIIEDDCLCDSGIASLAGNLGITDRHLRRVFAKEFGVAPVQYLQTRRLLLAKSLLTDTGLPVTKVAMAAGFGSIRRFNDLFRKNYRLSPSALRKCGAGATSAKDEGITVFLGYRPPYGWDRLIAFLGSRAIPGVEEVVDGVYRRTISARIGGERYSGWIAVSHAGKRNALSVTIEPALLPVLPRVLASVRNLFDLDCDPAEVYGTLAVMNAFKPGVCREGARVPGCVDPFEMGVRTVLGQQITVKAARTLATRLARQFGAPVTTPFEGLTHAFPTPEAMSDLGETIESRLGELGIIRSRSRSIRALAGAMIDGAVTLSPAADPGEQMRRLLELPGFGPWTVQYLTMRTLAWPDAFPHTDYGVKMAMDNRPPGEILALAEQWRPWRSYATINLWNSL
jgi:AraC family transcriptional regulator of adaptative response / DNA-3-methyladenine glycosylase II